MNIPITSSIPANGGIQISDPADKPRGVPSGDTSFQQVLAHASGEKGKLADAATQFEAFILGQVLKTARQSSDGGWLGTGEDQAGELGLELAEQQFTQAMASHGGLGIAKLVTANLQHRAKAASFDSESSPAQVLSSKDSADR